MKNPEYESSTRRDTDGGDRNVVSRRALLKCTVTAMPAILTLQSGAALARSSNLIGPANYNAKDRLGRTLCLDLKSVYPASRSGSKYDLGEPPYARVWAINAHDFHSAPSLDSPRVSQAQVCKNSVPSYYPKSDGYTEADWKEVNVHGMVVSATAMYSFAGKISLTNI